MILQNLIDIIKIFRYPPLVSVVIPIYDRKQILIESIQSILDQTYNNYEILLIADGSPNETEDIIRSYETKYKNVRAFYFPDNSGNPIRGRNKGILEAKGDYIAFHDSDDIAEPKRLKYSIKALIKFDADIVYGNWRAILESKNLRTDILNDQIVNSSEFNMDILKINNFICQSTVTARREALIDVGGFNDKMKYREDHELWLRLAYHGFKFKSINKVLTNLRLHNENLELKYKKDDEYWYNQMLKLYKTKINFDI